MGKKLLKCCYMKNNIQCKNKADFEIMENTRTDPDNSTHGCTKHVGEMLGTTVGHPECKSWTVFCI